jgi:ribosome-associated heat shock protein Hsp15
MPTRLDKWLWAARFFKTRSLAKEAIEGGKVHYQDQRTKVSKEVHVGDIYKIRQGLEEKIIEVLDLSETRGPASVAQTLYKETPESIALRAKHQEERKLLLMTAPDHRPDKRDRRKIIQFKQNY